MPRKAIITDEYSVKVKYNLKGKLKVAVEKYCVDKEVLTRAEVITQALRNEMKKEGYIK